MRRTRNPKFVPIDPKGASGQIRENKALSFLLNYFFPGLAYWSDPWADFHARWLKLRAITQESAFLGSVRWPKTFTGSNSAPPPKKNRQNWALICSAERLSCTSMKIDVMEEWRHWRVAALQRKRCQLVFDDHCQTYSNLLPNCCQKCQIMVPIHIDLNKLRTHFCARLRP